jgi:hypothetical protein
MIFIIHLECYACANISSHRAGPQQPGPRTYCMRARITQYADFALFSPSYPGREKTTLARPLHACVGCRSKTDEDDDADVPIRPRMIYFRPISASFLYSTQNNCTLWYLLTRMDLLATPKIPTQLFSCIINSVPCDLKA